MKWLHGDTVTPAGQRCYGANQTVIKLQVGLQARDKLAAPGNPSTCQGQSAGCFAIQRSTLRVRQMRRPARRIGSQRVGGPRPPRRVKRYPHREIRRSDGSLRGRVVVVCVAALRVDAQTGAIIAATVAGMHQHPEAQEATDMTALPGTAAETMSDYDLVRWYIDGLDFYKNPIYLVPSVASLRRSHRRETTREDILSLRLSRTGESDDETGDVQDVWADIPRLRSRIGMRGALPEQIALWKPWTRSGKLVTQVLRDIQRDTPEEMTYLDHWRLDSTRPFTGVTVGDAARSAACVAVFVSLMAVYALLIFGVAGSAGAGSAERCVAAGGVYADLGGGLFSPSWSCEYPAGLPSR